MRPKLITVRASVQAFLFFVVATLLCPDVYSSTATSVIRDAKIYALGKTSESPVFLQTSKLDTNEKGVTHELTIITDLQKKPVLSQEADYNGDKLIDQHVMQYQTGKSFLVTVDKDHVTFKTFDFDGVHEKPTQDKDGEQTEKIDGPFLTGPVSDGFLRSHFKSLQDGDTISVRFGVLELAETVGFKFFKIDSKNGLFTVRMKASSLFISMALDPIDISLDPTTHLMMRYVGRTPLRIKDQGKLKPFDGEIVY